MYFTEEDEIYDKQKCKGRKWEKNGFSKQCHKSVKIDCLCKGCHKKEPWCGYISEPRPMNPVSPNGKVNTWACNKSKEIQTRDIVEVIEVKEEDKEEVKEEGFEGITILKEIVHEGKVYLWDPIDKVRMDPITFRICGV